MVELDMALKFGVRGKLGGALGTDAGETDQFGLKGLFVLGVHINGHNAMRRRYGSDSRMRQ